MKRNAPVSGKRQLPDCSKLSQRLPKKEKRIDTDGKKYGINEYWVEGLPQDIDAIDGFECHDDWLDGFGVFVKQLPLTDFFKKTQREGDEESLTLYKDQDSLWVSFDTEFTGGEGVTKRWKGRRQVVSWQFCFARLDEMVELMVIPRTKTPLCLCHALNLICELVDAPKYFYKDGYSRDVLDPDSKRKKPEAYSVTMISHAGLVDFSTFRGSKHLFQRMCTQNGALFNAKNYRVLFERDKSKNSFRHLDIKVRDTMSFTSKGTRLADIGESIGLGKLDTMSEEDYMDMGAVLKNEPTKFAAYAIRDVEICWTYMAHFLGAYDKAFGATIPSLSSAYLKKYIMDNYCDCDSKLFEHTFRGYKVVNRGYKKAQKSDVFYADDRLVPVSPTAGEFMTLCKLAYRGGLNACTIPGFFEEDSYDYDLTSAYPLCLGTLIDPDWDEGYLATYENEDITLDDLPDLHNFPSKALLPGAGSVTFEFPEDCYQPCISVASGSSLILPRTSGDLNGVYVTMPEVVTALRLGARVHAVRFVIATPFPDDGMVKHAYKTLIDKRAEARETYGKKSVQETALKLLCNTLYGKMAQSLSPKSHRDLMTLQTSDLTPSDVTSAYHAAMGTALTRCVMASAANELHDLGYKVYSTTTDGFISNAPKDVLDTLPLAGLREPLRQTRAFYTDGKTDDIFEVKHINTSLLNITTRADVSMNPEGVFARGGLKERITLDENHNPSVESRAIFISKVLLRRDEADGNAHYTHNQWVNAADMLIEDEDFHNYPHTPSVNFNFDMKRKPVMDTMVDVPVTVPGTDTTVAFATFDTKAFDTPEEFNLWKAWSKELLEKQRTPLIEKADYETLQASVVTGPVKPRSTKHRDLIAYVLRAHRAVDIPVHIPELESLRGKRRIDWLNSFLGPGERKFTANDWKNASKPRLIAALPEIKVYQSAVDELMGVREPATA